jgi:hypothetical protein
VFFLSSLYDAKRVYGTLEDLTRNPLSKVGEVGNGERKGKRGDRGFYMDPNKGERGSWSPPRISMHKVTN